MGTLIEIKNRMERLLLMELSEYKAYNQGVRNCIAIIDGVLDELMAEYGEKT